MALEKLPSAKNVTQVSLSETLRRPWSRKGVLDHLVGIAGLGWTTSFLAFLGTALGYGTGLVTRFVTAPQSLLYFGIVFFVGTLGLERLNKRLAEEN